MPLTVITGIISVSVGLLSAGRQFFVLFWRQPQREKRARYPVWHDFRVGLFLIVGGTGSIVSGYSPPTWLDIVVIACAVTVVAWDRALWFRHRQRA